MKGYVTNIEKLSLENENFRKVLYTDKNSQKMGVGKKKKKIIYLVCNGSHCNIRSHWNRPEKFLPFGHPTQIPGRH